MNNNWPWFYGVVENVNDPIPAGRVQVRIRGVHEWDRILLPTDFLPWAQVMTSATSASQNGVGRSPTGLVVGNEVFGITLDDSYTDLRILFTWTTGEDISPLAKGLLDSAAKAQHEGMIKGVEISKSNKIDEPAPDRNSIYPLNDVNTSRAGFVKESDSSNGARESEIHPSGNYREWRTDGGVSQRLKYLFNFVKETFYNSIGESWINTVAGNVINRFTSDFYQSVSGQNTVTAPNGLYHFTEAMELDTPEVRVSGNMRAKGVLYIPEIRVGKLYANDISCSGVIEGISKFAEKAVIAGGSGSVVPEAGEGPGMLSFDMLLNDNGGDYPASQTVTGGKVLPLKYEINRPVSGGAVDKAWVDTGLDRVEKVSGGVAGKMLTDSLKFGPEGAWQCVQRALNAMNDKGSWPILVVDGKQTQETVDSLDKAVKRRGQDHVLNCINIARFTFILEKVEADPSQQPKFKELVEDESFLKLPSDPDEPSEEPSDEELTQ